MALNIAACAVCSAFWMLPNSPVIRIFGRVGWSRWKTTKSTFGYMASRYCYKSQQLLRFNALAARKEISTLNGNLFFKIFRRGGGL